MSGILTTQDLTTFAPAAATYLNGLNDACDHFQISTPRRIRYFLSQCAHESNGFRFVEENLNYGAEGLLATFPSHFDASNVNDYARQPIKIADRVYALRMGNGDEASGDGWTYRGRGLIQLTGRASYTACGAAMNLDFVETPDLLTQPYYAALSAGWFWGSRMLNKYADALDFQGATRVINGGLNGLPDRLQWLEKAQAVWPGT